MIRTCLLALIFISQCLCSAYAATYSLTAHTDRQQLYLGESLELRLELDDLSYFLEPDLSVLKHDFELLSSQRSNQTMTQQWVFQLLPKKAGALKIPAIALGKYSSKPISIQVKQFRAPNALAVEPVYMDSQVDKEHAYLQEQVILTLRIYHSVPLYASGQLSTLSMPQARVIPLGKPRTAEQFINGIRHGVIEIRYAIFPQATGTLAIPSLTFTATLTGHDPSSLEPPSNLPGQRIEVSSAQIPLQVIPPPAEFPSDSPWLPARSLKLEQQWSPEQPSLFTNQALNQSVLIRAEGLPNSSIPKLLTQQYESFYSYANPVEQQQLISESGVSSLTQERLALVAMHSGELQVPALKLPWWNTQSDQLEYAQLPAYSVQFKPKQTELSLNQEPHLYTDLRIWQIACALLAVTSLVLLFLWRRARHLPAIKTAHPSSNTNTTRLVENLRRACRDNDPIQARTALDALARHSGFTPNAVAKFSSNFHNALTNLNAVLYTDTEQKWQGEELWRAFAELKNTTTQQEQETLPPLYPS